MNPPTPVDATPRASVGEPATSRYILIAQPDVARAAWCLEVVKPLGLGALVARDADEAIGILRQFGAPVLLLTTLSLPRGDGFAVARALRSLAGPHAAAIIGLTSVTAPRLSLEARKALGINSVLPYTARADALREAIDRALEPMGISVPSPLPQSTGRGHEPASIDRALRDLADEATRLTGVPGVAVYVKAAPHDRFRAHVSWHVEDANLRSPFSFPYVFERVVETAGPLVLADLASQPFAAAARIPTVREAVRGLVAVPLVGTTGRVLGAVCVFDVKPIAIGGANVDGLQALGRRMGPMIEAVSPMEGGARSSGDGMTTLRSPGGVGDVVANDPVTGLPTRRGSRALIATEVARARDTRRPLSLVLLAIDDFAGMDPRHEAPVIDGMLRMITLAVTSVLRRSDSAVRWAPGKFLIVLPDMDLNTAGEVAGRIRVATGKLLSREVPPVTISAAVTELPPGEEFDVALQRLVGQLNEASRRGGNLIA
jgi:diguanylate cyclase (GGDEF)-like protein